MPRINLVINRRFENIPSFMDRRRNRFKIQVTFKFTVCWNNNRNGFHDRLCVGMLRFTKTCGGDPTSILWPMYIERPQMIFHILICRLKKASHRCTDQQKYPPPRAFLQCFGAIPFLRLKCIVRCFTLSKIFLKPVC